MKRAIQLCSAAVLASFLLCSAATAEKKLNVVTTIFPVHDWVREVVGGTTDHV